MASRCVRSLRNHWHALLIIPLVVIVMTWPAFAHIFDRHEFWLHSQNYFDALQKFWDAWHLERFLAGKTAYFYTDAMFHPRGLSLAFHGTSTPHALLLLALQQLIPVDDAYSLLYLLMLCFNGLCAYVLIHHLLQDKRIALFGAVVVGVHVNFTYVVTAPDILMMGTAPLALYFLHRSVMENRQLYAFLAGLCAGITAFIGLYVLVILLISLGIYTAYLSIQLWRDSGFWRRVLLALAVCLSISLVRIHPIISDASALNDELSVHLDTIHSGDILRFFVHSRNPLTGDFLHAALGATHDVNFKNAYLGYINLVFIAIAILRAPRRRQLTPWLVTLVSFAVLSLGDYLTFNGQAHTNIVLPERTLTRLFPFPFGAISNPEFYLLGVVTPLAVLSCYGLRQMLRSTRPKVRAAFALLSVLILAIEYFQQPAGYTIKREKIAYIDWLRSEVQSPVKIIDLPQSRLHSSYYLYTQSVSGYSTAFGFANRSPGSAPGFIFDNYLLGNWRLRLPAVCLPGQTSASYINSLDQLLRDGFTHIVLHRWLLANGDLAPSFVNVPAAYDDEFVSVYRLEDLRRNCEATSTLPLINRLLQQPWVLPGDGSSIISIDRGKSIDSETLAYLGLLFSDWDSLRHAYREDGEWKIQSARQSDADGEASARNWRVIHLLYNERHEAPPMPESIEFRNEFNLCRRETYEDGAIIELYLNPRFSCALIELSDPLRIEYENGALIENMLYEFKQNIFDLQILWRNLPEKTHSLSVQVFDAAGDKAHGQDFVIGRRAVTRHGVDLSSLSPGDYVVKLIFYQYATGKSVSGAVSSSGARFDRELKFATIRKS